MKSTLVIIYMCFFLRLYNKWLVCSVWKFILLSSHMSESRSKELHWRNFLVSIQVFGNVTSSFTRDRDFCMRYRDFQRNTLLSICIRGYRFCWEVKELRYLPGEKGVLIMSAKCTNCYTGSIVIIFSIHNYILKNRKDEYLHT